jgi:hypothetical protein
MRSKAADERLALALAEGKTTTDAAKLAGIGLTTAKRRQADADFRELVATYRKRMVDEAIGRLTATATAAADTLRQNLTAEAEAVQVRAAEVILRTLGVGKSEAEPAGANINIMLNPQFAATIRLVSEYVPPERRAPLADALLALEAADGHRG